jgi:glutathione peroxidase
MGFNGEGDLLGSILSSAAGVGPFSATSPTIYAGWRQLSGREVRIGGCSGRWMRTMLDRPKVAMMDRLSDIPLRQIDGSADSLVNYRGKVVLVVNVASKCGLTPQYEGLEKLYQDKRGQGLVVLGFPANDFKGQEPGSDEEISSFCSMTYDVHFPLFSKIAVTGEDRHPLYSALTKAQPAAIGDGPFRERLEGKGIVSKDPADVLWNFEKFLLSRRGEVVARFAPDVTASDPRLTAAIDAELAKD